MGWLNLLTVMHRKYFKICAKVWLLFERKIFRGLGNVRNVFSIDSGATSYATLQLGFTWYHRGYHHQKFLYHHKSCVPQSQPKAKYKQKKTLKKMFFYWELFCRLVLNTMSGRKNLWLNWLWHYLWHLVWLSNFVTYCDTTTIVKEVLQQNDLFDWGTLQCLSLSESTSISFIELLVWWFSNLTMMIMLQHKCNPEIPNGFYYPSICNQSSSAESRLA